MNTLEDSSLVRLASAGAFYLLQHCGGLTASENVLIITDSSTEKVGNLLVQAAKVAGGNVTSLEAPAFAMHGQEPSAEIAQAMLEAHLILGVTSKSMAHTKARRAACNAGSRYLSLPEYSLELLADPAVKIDYLRAGAVAKRVADAFTNGRSARVTTALGTDITLHLEGRTGNCCPGYVARPSELGSPPDIEANVSPEETKSNGVVVVDGSVPYPGLGLLAQPIRLEVADGSIVDIAGDESIVCKLTKLFDSTDSRKTRILAECGVGLNPLAKLSGIMLADEGAMGTMHFGFGSNATVGGLNDVPFHLDFVFTDPTLVVDGVVILNDGVCVI